MIMYIYNIILPVWMFFLFSWWIFLAAIVGNFVIDYGIYEIYIRKTGVVLSYKWKYIWRAYLFGFLADFIGAALLFFLYEMYWLRIDFYRIYNSPQSIIAHIIVVVLVGVIIYFLNKWNLKRSEFSTIEIHRLALIMAIVTAPFTFLIPASLFGY